MNAKRIFKGAVVRVASITLALLMVFSMGVTLLTAYAATGSPTPPSPGVEVSSDQICLDCNRFIKDTDRDLAVTAAAAAATAAGTPDASIYYKVSENGVDVYYTVDPADLCLKETCSTTGCKVVIVDCEGHDTGSKCTCTGGGDVCILHCDTCRDAHKKATECRFCHKYQPCSNEACPICTGLNASDICTSKCHECDSHTLICSKCGGARCDEEGSHYVFNSNTGEYDLKDKCNCIYCSKDGCNKLLAYKDGSGYKFTGNECEHFDITDPTTFFCENHCSKCTSGSPNEYIDIEKDKGTYTIPVSDTAPLTFKVTKKTGFTDGTYTVGGKNDITITDAEGKEVTGVEFVNGSTDTSGNDIVTVKGLTPGDYKVKIPISLKKSSNVDAGKQYVTFNVKVYDPTKLPDDIKNNLTLKINDIVDNKSYKPGDIHFGAEGSSTDKDVTVTPSTWTLADKDGKAISGKENIKFDEKDGKFESDLKKLEKGTYNLTVKYNVKDGTGKTYVATKTIKFSVSKNSSGKDNVDTADNTKIYVTAFIVSLCILTFTVIGMAAYLKRRNRPAPAGHRSFR